MSAHDEYMTRRQARDLARRLARLERKTRSTAAAHADLRHSALDQGARIPIKDEQGNTTAYVGSGPTGIEHVDGPVPEQPSAPFVDVGPRVVKVQSSGLDVNENPAPDDLKHVEVHVAQDEVFEPSWSTFATNMDTANGSVTHSLPAGEWYVGLVWVTLSGKRSVMSEIVLAVIEPPVDVQDLQDTLDTAQARLDEYRDEVAAPRFQALEEGFVVHETNISDARDRLEAAESTLAPLPGQVSEARDFASDAMGRAEAAEARAVEASNNASNRLTNGGFELGLDHWDVVNVTLSSDANTGNQSALIGVGGSLSPDASIPVSEGDVWDVSAYAKNGSALVVDVINSADNTVLESFTTSTVSSWSETGRLRVEVTAGVSYVNIRITGDGVLVDDVVLRDVTDVVRLERAATAARQTADQALAELELMRLAVDGEGGLKDRLTSAETVLETKADESALDQLDQKLAGDLAAFEAHYTRVWRQPTPPPPGTHYEWLGEPHASESIKRVDGVEVARNWLRNASFKLGNEYWTHTGSGDVNYDNDGVTLTHDSGGNTYFYQGVKTQIPDVDENTNFTVSIWVRGQGEVSVGWGAPAGRSIIPPTTIDSDEAVRIVGTATDFGNWNLLFYLRGAGHVVYEKVQLEVSDTAATTYFDGSTESDRANDLWYNTDGVPHEWVNGTNGNPGGWVELSDDRINQLQTDVVEAAETAYLDRLVVRDEIVTPETITNRLWADLGVFNRLQAREGWIGGTLLADGAVTAEKITATREMVTKIMGAEWAYISERLVVDGKILTRDLEALSAAIQSLTVTQRADIAELWAEELWTALAVIEELQAEEAWITSAMISELTAEKVTVTQEFVARVASFIEVFADKFWANEAFIDRMASSEAYFGSEDADQQTRVDGTGLRITKHDAENETSTDIVRLGGEGIGLVFSDEQGEITGSLSHEGDASFRDMSADRVTVGGRLLLPDTDPADFWDGNLWDSQPKGLVCFHEEDMSGVSVNHIEYGFIEVSHHVKANRKYRVSTNNFLMDNSQAHYGRFRYTLGDNPPAPHTASARLGNAWLINAGQGSIRGNVQVRGDHTFTPPQDGLMRILLCVSRAGSTPGISFNNSAAYATAQLRLEDLGPTRPYTGMTRNAGHGGAGTVRDPRPLVGGITTAWDMTWYQNFSHGGDTPQSSSNNRAGYGGLGPSQGWRQDSAFNQGAWLSNMGFGASTESTNATDQGISLAAALNGADLLSMYLEITGGFSWHSNNFTEYGITYHGMTTPPSQYVSSGTLLSNQRVQVGQTIRIPLPVSVLENPARNGVLRGFGFNAGTSNTSSLSRYAGQLSWAHRPRLVVTYQR